MKILLVLFGAFLLFTRGNALECYSCTNCAPSFLTFVEDTDICGFTDDACYKEIEDDGSVNRGCGSSITCTAKDVLPGRCVDDLVKPCYICCQGDKCNSSTTVAVSIVTLVLSIGATVITQLVRM